jgi:hypothetical protein
MQFIKNSLEFIVIMRIENIIKLFSMLEKIIIRHKMENNSKNVCSKVFKFLWDFYCAIVSLFKNKFVKLLSIIYDFQDMV